MRSNGDAVDHQSLTPFEAQVTGDGRSCSTGTGDGNRSEADPV